jgi:DNA-binding transcriptional MerR regulator
MKRLLTAITLTLALNFLAVAGGVGYLAFTGKVDRDKARQIREIVFPAAGATTQPTTPETTPATRPAMGSLAQLEELLRRQSGRPMSEQVQFLQQRFDSQKAILDRRDRELQDRARLVELAQKQLASEREAFAAERKQFDTDRTQAQDAVVDQGFEDSLNLYKSMPARQVKQVFVGLDDETVIKYLRAMEPRAAGRIVKEFKTPAEIDQIQRILESMRKAGVPLEASASTANPVTP